MTTESEPTGLIKRLLELKAKQDRGGLAALRSGLGKVPGEAPRMFPFVAPFLPGGASTGPRVTAVFLTASLFAKHPEHNPAFKNFGTSLRASIGKHLEDGVEARLTATLDAHPDELPRHLEGLLSLVESAGVGVNWDALYKDLPGLLGDNEDWRNRIRLAWAREFWGHTTTETD